MKDNGSSLSDRDDQRSFVYKALSIKTERLVSAVHLVTSLMDNMEGLRVSLRNVSLETINDFYEMSGGGFAKDLVQDRILERIDHILSLLEISMTGALISKMNYSILHEEYLKLRAAIVKYQLTKSNGSPILPKDFFGIDAIDNMDSRLPVNFFKTIRNDTIKDGGYKRHSFAKKTSSKLQNEDSDSMNIKTTVDKSRRQEIIMANLKDNHEYAITDIISVVTLADPTIDCSNKTIQRDLIFLTSAGMLNKKGERRWSRYSRRVTQ